jgi:hypothetical protein
MKKYLDNTIFTFDGVIDNRFFSYSTRDKSKGEIIVELALDQDAAEVIHNDCQGNTFSYEVANLKELQGTVEYILDKKVISEEQWEQGSRGDSSSELFDDWDIES